jgi:hypothetical protein
VEREVLARLNPLKVPQIRAEKVREFRLRESLLAPHLRDPLRHPNDKCLWIRPLSHVSHGPL